MPNQALCLITVLYSMVTGTVLGATELKRVFKPVQPFPRQCTHILQLPCLLLQQSESYGITILYVNYSHVTLDNSLSI